MVQQHVKILISVALCCIAEVILLLTALVPSDLPYWGTTPRFRAALLSAFLLIPFIGWLFSVFVYGSHRWLQRAALRVSLPLIYIVILVAISGVASVTENETALNAALLLVLGLGPLFCLTVLWRITRRRAVALEINHWLAARAITPEQIRERRRALRVALWLPAATVLLVLALLPEMWAIFTHAYHPRPQRIGDYEVPIPFGWIELQRERNSAIGLNWMHLALLPRYDNEVGILGLSDWSFSYGEESATFENENVLSRESVPFADSTALCSRFEPRYGRPASATYLYVRCASPDGFHARFEGDPKNLAAFYRVLSAAERQP